MSSKATFFAIAGLILAAALCARLGFWQLDRLHQRRAANRVVLAAREEPPLSFPGAGLSDSDSTANRRVVAMGRYDHDREIVVRGQTLDGVPGVEVVTPLRIAETGTAVLVNRGFVPAPDALTANLDSLREPGEKRVEGFAVVIPAEGGKPLQHDGKTTWAQLDLDALRREFPYPILPVYLRQSLDPSLPSFPRRLPPQELDDGPHLNYAVQWFLFAAMALGFAIVVGVGFYRPTTSERPKDGSLWR